MPDVAIATARPGVTCHGCKHCHYTAPRGQAGDYPGRPAILSQPHSRCLELADYIPMIVDVRGKWLGSDVPPACTVHHRDGPSASV